MLFGLCTHPYHSVSLQELLPKLASWGYQAVELSAWPQHPCHPVRIKKTGTAYVRDLLRKHGLRLSALAAHTQWVGVHEVVTQRALDYTRLCIDVAHALEAPCVVTNSGAYPAEVSRHESWERLLSGMAIATEYAEANDVVLALEPHVNHMVFTWESAQSILRQIDSPYFKINFDASHWFIAGFDERLALEQLRPYVVHVRLRDYRLRRIPLADGRYEGEAEPCSLGEGSFDLAGHLEHLRLLGYDGVVSATLFVADLDAAARKSALFLHQLLGGQPAATR